MFIEATKLMGFLEIYTTQNLQDFTRFFGQQNYPTITKLIQKYVY